MKMFLRSGLVALALACVVNAGPHARKSSKDVEVNGVKYTSKGLVGFGQLPANAKEVTGDTLGGLGSAIALKPGSWQKLDNGSYTGTLYVHPDRGYNVEKTVDYQARHHALDFVLTPYTKSKKLSFEDAQKTFQVTYTGSVLKTERDGKKTTGLDAAAVRDASGIDPQLPIPSTSIDRLSLDVEGMVANADGSYVWVSDEYGPYIYLFSADGALLHAIAPPAAVLPTRNGSVNFTSVEDPDAGRAANQGMFENLTLDPATQTLYAMLQSATVQDGGDDDETSRHTRLLAYDVSGVSTADGTGNASYVGEWVVQLPVSGNKGKTRKASEIHFVSNGTFLVLCRDGKGAGDDDSKAKYKNIGLFSLSGATDISNSAFDDPANALAKGGELVDSVSAAEVIDFIDLIDDDELERFGLHNGGDADDTLIASKWESLAVASVQDDQYPDDYFVFTAADNDFITTDGVSVGEPYDAGADVANQFLVFRATLPGYSA
ncbi:esterase-like activity of phytase-domain-containing protein [Schizophyllum commune]